MSGRTADDFPAEGRFPAGACIAYEDGTTVNYNQAYMNQFTAVNNDFIKGTLPTTGPYRGLTYLGYLLGDGTYEIYLDWSPPSRGVCGRGSDYSQTFIDHQYNFWLTENPDATDSDKAAQKRQIEEQNSRGMCRVMIEVGPNV